MKQVAVRFPAKLHKQAKTAAKKEGQTFGGFVRNAVLWRVSGVGTEAAKQ